MNIPDALSLLIGRDIFDPNFCSDAPISFKRDFKMHSMTPIYLHYQTQISHTSRLLNCYVSKLFDRHGAYIGVSGRLISYHLFCFMLAVPFILSMHATL